MEEKKKSGVGTVLAGVLIFAFLIAFVMYRGGFIGASEDDATSEQEKGPGINQAVEVTVGENFLDKIDFEEGKTLITFQTEEEGIYTLQMDGGKELDLTMQTYAGGLTESRCMLDGTYYGIDQTTYRYYLSDLEVLAGNATYYVMLDWKDTAHLDWIKLEFEPAEAVETNTALVKELGAVKITVGEDFSEHVVVGEDCWFYFTLEKEQLCTFDFFFNKKYEPGKSESEFFLYRQDKNGDLFTLAGGGIFGRSGNDPQINWAPMSELLPGRQVYFVRINLDEDYGLTKAYLKPPRKLS